MTTLYKTLQHHAEQCYYPFHMPGHKGGRLGIFTEILQQDITEIEGFDNLHQPNGILLESQKKMCRYIWCRGKFLFSKWFYKWHIICCTFCL